MGLLSVHNVFKHFSGLAALNSVSLAIDVGEVVGVIGPNGAGKTTLLNIMSALERPSEGEVFFKGERIDHLPPHTVVHRGIGRSFQVVRLFDEMTALENVMVGRHSRTKAGILQILGQLPLVRAEERQTRDYAMTLLKTVNLVDQWRVAAGHLSTGQRRRLEIARAMACQPELLLLDEPGAGLDPAERVRIINLINLIQVGGTSICVVEHRLRIVRAVSHRVVVLNFGVKIADGPPAQVLGDPEVIRAYLGKEFR